MPGYRITGTVHASLAGNLHVTGCDGQQIAISGDIRKRLFAILLRARNMRCTNDKLVEFICPGVKEPEESLRQHRFQLNRVLRPHGAEVTSMDRITKLNGVVDVTGKDAVSDVEDEFFSDIGDAPTSEAFEDWLRQERSHANAAQASSYPAPGLHLARSHVRLGLVVPVTTGGDLQAAVMTDWAANCLRDIFFGNSFFDMADLRRSPGDAAEMDYWVEVRVTQISTVAEISIAALQTETNRCLFSRTHSCTLDAGFHDHRDELATFIASCVAAIQTAVARSSGFGLLPWTEAPLFEIVSRIFRQERRSVLNGIEALGRYDSTTNPASVLAWRAFGNMLLSGEQMVLDASDAIAEAQMLVHHALEVDSANPTALAVAAHFSAFIMRDYDRADILSREALKIAPFSPFSRDVRAMLELYSGALETGYHTAHLASRMAKSGPLRHYVDASVVVAATLTGDHETAIRRGREILSFRPGFLPVMRHMVASYAHLGDTESMHTLLAETQRLDPVFGTVEMLSPDYALPSEQSRTTILTALKHHNLFRG